MRRAGNRLAVVDALLDLYGEGDLAPSAAAVAARAGVSRRSLFRYFADMDDLCRIALARQLERAHMLLGMETDPDAPLACRIAAVVAQRTRLFGAVEPAATVLRAQAPFQTTLAALLRRNRALLRDQLRTVFAPELAAVGTIRAGELLSAMDVLCSFESYQLLCNDQHLSVEDACSVMTSVLTALLGPR